MKIKKMIRRLCLFSMVSACVACAGKRYQQPDADLPVTFRGQDSLALIDTTVTIAEIPYQDFFANSELADLINEGLRHNNNLLVAVKQIDMASQGLKQAKLGNIPSLNLTAGNVSVTRPSDNSLNGSFIAPFLGQSYIEDYSSTLSLSWEADIWGKIRGQKEAALAAYLETQEAAKAVRTKLVSDIAQGYYNLLMLDVQLDIADQSIALFDSTITMTKIQWDMGLTTTLAVQQQEAARDEILATVPVIKQGIIAQENALSILTGKMPGEINRTKGLRSLKAPEILPLGVPAAMLALRPDVKQSELQLRQSVAATNVARASMYPALNITAQGGLNALKASNWFKIPGSLTGMAVGSVTQPLFNGRQLKTQYKQAQLASEQAELRFKDAVLNAVGEVSNTLTELSALKEQEQTTKHLVENLEQTVKNAILLFNSDMANYLEVLTAQSNKLQAELSLADIQRKQLSAAVTLYRAVGGGWK